jgi:hypothetical protein
MTFLRKTLALGAAFAVAVSLFAALTATASAQTNPPFIAYGTGATSGDEIGIWSGTTECTTTTADADGNWGPVQVTETLGDCSFSDGDTISFSLNGDVAEQTETWAAGGAPADVATGTVLSAAAGGGTTPEPGDTGNAGFASTAGTSALFALLLAASAAVVVAGGRAATRAR